MKAKLEFNFPEDKDEFKLAFNGPQYFYVLWDFDQYLRGEMKYNDDLTDEEYNTYDKIREKLYDIMSDHFVRFDEIE